MKSKVGWHKAIKTWTNVGQTSIFEREINQLAAFTPLLQPFFLNLVYLTLLLVILSWQTLLGLFLDLSRWIHVQDLQQILEDWRPAISMIRLLVTSISERNFRCSPQPCYSTRLSWLPRLRIQHKQYVFEFCYFDPYVGSSLE